MLGDVERATHRDVDVIVETLANAFAADPLLLWVLRQPHDVEKRLRAFFRATITAELRRAGHGVHRNADASCVAVWKTHPADEPDDRWAIVRQAPALLHALRLGIPRARQAAAATAAVHPAEPHYYLEVLGTRRKDQGEGHASTVLGHLLLACDAAGLGAYLETANPATVPF